MNLKMAAGIVSIAMVMVVAGPASARGGKGGGGGEGACAQDKVRLCAQAGNQHETMQCLEENREALSEACEAKLDKFKEKRQALKVACEADAQSLCGGLEGKELRQCMRDNKDDLSKGCSKALKAARKHKKHKGNRGRGHGALKRVCGEDIKAACGEVEPGEGRMRECIEAHRGEFSAACVEAMDEARGRRESRE